MVGMPSANESGLDFNKLKFVYIVVIILILKLSGHDRPLVETRVRFCKTGIFLKFLSSGFTIFRV